LAPALTEEEAIKVLRKVVEEAKKIGMPLVQQIEGFLQQIEQQNPGHQLDREKVIKTLILPHLGLPGKFESALQRAQDKVFDDFDVDEIEMEDAISYYSKQGNKEIKEMEEKLKALYKTFGGEVAEEEESSADNSTGKILTAEEVVNVLGQLAERMSELTDGYIEAFKEAHGLPQTPEHITAFQHGMMELSEEYVTNDDHRCLKHVMHPTQS
jgi:hypothetical protein